MFRTINPIIYHIRKEWISKEIFYERQKMTLRLIHNPALEISKRKLQFLLLIHQVFLRVDQVSY